MNKLSNSRVYKLLFNKPPSEGYYYLDGSSLYRNILKSDIDLVNKCVTVRVLGKDNSSVLSFREFHLFYNKAKVVGE